jgi:peptide/nickel transport system substrate-binding protein
MGVSGLVTESFEDFFWMPLPQHAWDSMNASELLASEQAARSPLGWGPYVVDEWVSGEYIRLMKNEQYFRADEGLPKYDYVTYKFIAAGDVDQSVSGACDIVASDVLDLSQAMNAASEISGAGYDLLVADSSEFEFLAFGISQASYDDGYYPYGADRPAIFSDMNTRRAIALCIDRQSILDELTGGLVDVSSSYLSGENYLMNGLSLSQYEYDPVQAKTLLEEVGWLDFDQNPETPLTMTTANANVPYGTSFSITLYSSRSEMRALIAQHISDDLAECGIEVTVQQDDIQNLYQPGPDGAIFGRNFDLALLSMNIGTEPHCGFFTTEEIPSETNYWLGTVTGGSNFMGYSSEAYDEACKSTQAAGLDTNAYMIGIQNTLQILSSELPFIPLYHHPEFVLLKKESCLPNDINNNELMQSIELLDPYASCTQ